MWGLGSGHGPGVRASGPQLAHATAPRHHPPHTPTLPQRGPFKPLSIVLAGELLKEYVVGGVPGPAWGAVSFFAKAPGLGGRLVQCVVQELGNFTSG